MSGLVGKAVSGFLDGVVVVLLGRLLLPDVVKRLRRDPCPSFPPHPLHAHWGRDGAANAARFAEAVRSLVPDLAVAPGDDENEIQLTRPQVSQGGVCLSWDDFGPTSEAGTVYVDLPDLDASFELDLGADPRNAFWVSVGYLRDGPVFRKGRAWVRVKEVGLWTPFADATRVTDFEPEWVSELPD